MPHLILRIIGIIGFVSGILCAQADVPLAWSGRPDSPVDAHSVGRISPWWTEVPASHFGKAFWLSCIGQPGTYLTMWTLAVLISQRNPTLGLLLKINTAIGAYTGLLFHAVACTKPLVYRAIAGHVSEDVAQTATDAVGVYARIPSLCSALSLFLGTTVLVAIAILQGSLPVPRILLVCNPVGAVVLVLVLRKLHIRIGGALGIGFSLFAVVLLVASRNV